MIVSPVDRGEAGGWGGGGRVGTKASGQVASPLAFLHARDPKKGARSGLPVTHLHLKWQRNGLEVHQDGHAFHSRFQS